MKEMPDTCPGCGEEFRTDGTCPSTLDTCSYAGLDVYEIAEAERDAAGDVARDQREDR